MLKISGGSYGISSYNQDINIKRISTLGQKVGSGSQKDVFMSRDNPGRCICLIREKDIGHQRPIDVAQKEIEDMNSLKSMGLPVIQGYGVVRYNNEYGVEREYIRGAIDSEDIIHGKNTLPEGRLFNENIQEDCNKIMNILKERNIQIEDMQFLLDEYGRVFINDARGVTYGNPQKGIDKVKELRGFAVANLLDFDSDEDV